MQIVYKNVDELIPYVNNPRINDHAVDAVASSIKNFGFKVPRALKIVYEIIILPITATVTKKLKTIEYPNIKADL